MTKRGSLEHEQALEEKLLELQSEGYKTINLYGKSPDGIAVKNGKIFAVEVLRRIKIERKNPEIIKKKGRFYRKFSGGITKTQKRANYDMFDDVIFKVV